MTCVLTSAYDPFHTGSSWSSMNSDTPPMSTNLERQLSQGYASSGSESRKGGSSSGKKRASRAGTRSVTTLSAAQLERKRANDREAQRAIRQRTKDHIDHLERSISEFRDSQHSSEKLVAVTQQRNRELEEEVAYLRTKLNEAGYPVNLAPPENQRSTESTLLSGHSTSSASQIPGSGSSVPNSTATPRSLSVTTSQSSASRHGSFQQQSNFTPGAPSSAVSIPSVSSMPSAVNLTTWRSHDGTSSVHPNHPTATHITESPHPQPLNAYGQSAPERMEWAAAPQQYQYPVAQEQPRPQAYETSQPPHPPPAAPGQQQQYLQAPVPTYAPAPAPAQPPPYHAPHMPPQSEFQNLAVSSPAAYQVQQQPAYQQQPQPQAYQQTQAPQSYPQPQQPQAYQPPQPPQGYQQPGPYQMTPVQAPQSVSEYTSPHGQMQPPPNPTATYHPPPSEQHYVPQQIHPPMEYRGESGVRTYPISHYPSG